MDPVSSALNTDLSDQELKLKIYDLLVGIKHRGQALLISLDVPGHSKELLANIAYELEAIEGKIVVLDCELNGVYK